MLELGAEGTPYPVWVCSRPTSTLSLCKSTDRAIQKNELVQFSIGAKYMGYCGNMCRPFVIGKAPAPRASSWRSAWKPCATRSRPSAPGAPRMTYSRATTTSWRTTASRSSLSTGPRTARATRRSKGLWLADKADFTIQPNMLFNIDIWLSDGTYGMRYEDGVLVTGDGLRELTSWRREVIEL